MLSKLVVVGVCALALVNGATASLATASRAASVTWHGERAVYEGGFCVDKRGGDINDHVMKINGVNQVPYKRKRQAKCALQCLNIPGTTAAEVIWNQGNKGCYCHKSRAVAKGVRLQHDIPLYFLSPTPA